VERLAERFVRLLAGAVADPDRALGSLEILAPEERQTILREWNDTARAVASATLPELFAAQAAKTPDAVAAIFAERQLTYRELDERSSRLARYLRARGVGPEVVVGLCLERSLELIVGLLGILKAGGAYLPLDPDYPRERLAFMLGDADARLIVTQSALRAQLPASRALHWPAGFCRTTWPMSSTPRDRPEYQRASRLPTTAFPIWRQCRSSGSRSHRTRASCNSPRQASMRRSGNWPQPSWVAPHLY
jgi:non-ribosomal peptide synthetase component F